MMAFLILILFFLTGLASGWISVDFISIEILERFSSIDQAKFFIAGISGLLGLLIGLFVQNLKEKLVKQINTTPTDLLISRAIGLILGLVVANLLLAPILLLPLV